MTRATRLFLPFFIFAACSSQQASHNSDAGDTVMSVSAATPTIKDTFSKGIILPHIPCLSDASQSYALYIPAAKPGTTMPVIYFFDPHGDGALPLQHYKALADAFHVILIGSNNSKNGNDWTTTQNILNTLFSDAQSRLSFDPNRIYTCGFSGGAKVAGYAALHQDNIKGIITAGAGLPDEEPLRNFPFAITAMAGRGDMNMTDLVAITNALNQTATVHRLILFDGKHAWPPVDVMRTAFAALQFDAMRNHTIAADDSLPGIYTTEAKAKIKREEAAHQWVNAEQTNQLAINLVMNISNTDWFTNEEKAIANNPAYAQQQQQAQQLLLREENIKQTYQQQFTQGDINYWQKTITELQQEANSSTPQGAMYQRLLAYLSLAFYSLSNRLLTGNQNEAAQHFVTLYKMADATNPEAWYFSALLNARNNSTQAAQDDLIKAAGLGFTDTSRMMNQPEFATLSPQLNFALIKRKMKKAE